MTTADVWDRRPLGMVDLDLLRRAGVPEAALRADGTVDVAMLEAQGWVATDSALFPPAGHVPPPWDGEDPPGSTWTTQLGLEADGSA